MKFVSNLWQQLLQSDLLHYYKRDKVAIISSVVFLILALMALFSPIIAPFDELSESDLVQILQEPKNALIKQYMKFFEMENVTLTFTDDALAEVARQATLRKSGARGPDDCPSGLLTRRLHAPGAHHRGCTDEAYT